MKPVHRESNLDIDYVISYKIPAEDKAEAVAQFKKLVRSLADVGLQTEVRNGNDNSLLVFVKAADEKVFGDVVFRSRIKDWLHGVRQVQPDQNTRKALQDEPLTEAERYRQVHHMITATRDEGGASITPKAGEWKHVDAIFPLHNHERNRKWLNNFSSKTFLSPEDLDQVRDCVGEQIGYYYAFLQTYFTFLIFPAAFGFSCWVLLGHFSAIYAVFNGLWCIVFVEWWKRQESELAIRWAVKNVSSIEDKRREFHADKTIQDPDTGETRPDFPASERLKRQALQIPFALACIIALGTLILFCYCVEIFISEVYSGPFKSVLVFTPTIILTLCVPIISGKLTVLAERLTNYENYETQDSHDKAMVSKLFVINFITSYMAIFLTAFVYVPFASVLVPYLDIFGLTVKPFGENEKQLQTPAPYKFNINPNRLKNQMVYFAVTAQVVNFALETVVPLLKLKGTAKYDEMKTKRAEKHGGAAPSISANDPPEEMEFLARVREEAALPEYDVTSDLREMCIQYGYLALFSAIWPLTPVAYFINNWIELRGDTVKLTMECRRPNPQRADSIGPWLSSLEFLTWLGSVTSAALVYMFSGDGVGPDGKPHMIKLGSLMLCVFCSEHIYLIIRMAVRTAISKLDSSNMQKERYERFAIRKKYLEEAGLGDIIKPVTSGPNSPLLSQDGEKLGSVISRRSLEEDARNASLRESDPNSRFWNHQQGWQETEKVGLRLIDEMEMRNEGKKEQ